MPAARPLGFFIGPRITVLNELEPHAQVRAARTRSGALTARGAQFNGPSTLGHYLGRWRRENPNSLAMAGATNEDWGTWLLCNASLTDDRLKQAERLFPDSRIDALDEHGIPKWRD